MELRHLRYFLTVARTLNFTKAADELHMAQPPLSRQIRELEEEIGVALFERRGKRVFLSSAGQVFEERARQILKDTNSAIVDSQRAARGETGRVAVGFFEHIAYTLLPPLLRDFQQRYPAVTVELQWFSSAEQINALNRGDVDLAFVRSLPPNKQLNSVLLLQEPFYVAIAKDNPLAAKRRISIRDCKQLRVINYRKDVAPDYHAAINQLCALAGFSPSTSFEMGQIYASLGLVSAGFGVTLVPASVQRTHMENVVFRPLREEHTKSELYLAWKEPNSSAALGAFVELACKIAAHPPRKAKVE
ncbi:MULTISPECIES: LysR substrate-binding domain-containing protein [unclassified Caballeronia]|uniref:LysR family transcriptional regulator n=1 Tax=unclassified Caballeronia TaxID=2646786 RepID=UPI002864D97B|nr:MULTISPECIES: LysR substrate-binding domain-containing protein [unclassified Caballeronia]MDR5774049.1 LysR substrate-binding domain-containing protein [Caballeronia sp. LZ002]MDR5849484.1 LysR substrate-binding domain-containing protein [Caballeronia sp. LZ003]